MCEAEGISFDRVAYTDNSAVLDLMEGSTCATDNTDTDTDTNTGAAPTLGVFAMLEDEVRCGSESE